MVKILVQKERLGFRLSEVRFCLTEVRYLTVESLMVGGESGGQNRTMYNVPENQHTVSAKFRKKKKSYIIHLLNMFRYCY